MGSLYLYLYYKRSYFCLVVLLSYIFNFLLCFILHYITLHHNDNVFREETSITLQQFNAIEKMSFQSTSENR